jgi:hypothetical protein
MRGTTDYQDVGYRKMPDSNGGIARRGIITPDLGLGVVLSGG